MSLTTYARREAVAHAYSTDPSGDHGPDSVARWRDRQALAAGRTASKEAWRRIRLARALRARVFNGWEQPL